MGRRTSLAPAGHGAEPPETLRAIAEQSGMVADVAAEAAAPKVTVAADDVSLIAGVGPKVKEALAKEGITSLKQIAEALHIEIGEIV